MLPRKKKLSQAVIGYAILFCLIVSALLIVGRYVRNAFSGRVRQAGDSFGSGEVYAPYGPDASRD
ncbi:MAG: hypothetical protein GY858_06115 [Candidatus Omnitrophica bacterium]|nr:hypothetical protein [Candidatus Omnitrophota bacterium]